VLASKIVQKLANRAHFGASEEYLQRFNPVGLAWPGLAWPGYLPPIAQRVPLPYVWHAVGPRTNEQAPIAWLCTVVCAPAGVPRLQRVAA
jgi:hypothetical protein